MLSFLSDENDKSKEKEIKVIESKLAKVEALKSICDIFVEKFNQELLQLESK